MEDAVIEEESERDYVIKTVYCPDATDVEARNRHLQVTKFLHEHHTEGCTELAMNEAARRGHLEVVQFLHENRSEGCTEEAMDCVAWKGHLEIVKLLHANRSEGCTKDAMDYAAREGHLDVVRFLHENRNKGCSTRAIDFAASRGHLDVVQSLHENHTEGCTTSAMDEAAKGGHLDVVKFLHANHTEGCTSKAMDAAGKHGHLEIAKSLREKGLGGSTSKALNHAAYSGDLPMVKFLYAGCGTAGQAVYMACYGGSLDVLHFLVEEHHKSCTTEAVRDCVNYTKHLEVIRYLYESNQVTRPLLDALPIESWDRIHEMLKHAYLQQSDVRSAALQLKRAVVGNHALLVRVLCQYTSHGCLFEAKQVAVEQQNTGIAAILDVFFGRGLQLCSLAEHGSSGDVSRRCQKVRVEQPPSSV